MRDDMDQVFDDGVKAAVHFLEKSREFFPFGVVKTKEGDIRHVNVLDDNERPGSDQVIDMLRAALSVRAKQIEIVCAAIISDVRFKDTKSGLESDAIRADIEHAFGEPVTCYLPYRLTGAQVEAGEVVAQQGVARIFSAD